MKNVHKSINIVTLMSVAFGGVYVAESTVCYYPCCFFSKEFNEKFKIGLEISSDGWRFLPIALRGNGKVWSDGAELLTCSLVEAVDLDLNSDSENPLELLAFFCQKKT